MVDAVIGSLQDSLNGAVATPTASWNRVRRGTGEAGLGWNVIDRGADCDTQVTVDGRDR
jgi:hypothetical protein